MRFIQAMSLWTFDYWEAMLSGTNGVETIIFDLDGTLRHNRPTFLQGFQEAVRRLAPSPNPAQWRTAVRWLHYYWAQSPDLSRDRLRFADQQEEFWTNHARRHLLAYGYSPSQAALFAPQIQRYMAEEYQAENYVPPEVPESLALLRSRGYRIVLLSNRSAPCDEELQEIDLLKYFDFTLVAGEVNAWKPDPRIFHEALQRAASRPERTLYVGDNYFADVVGSRRAGIRPVLLDPEGIFVEADCMVIHSIGDLPDLLAQ